MFGNQRTLTIENLRDMVPSAFATRAHESRSDRFGYVPSGMIIEGMMKEGFAPVSASQSTARTNDKQAYTKHMIRFRHQAEMTRQAVVGESIREIVFVNAHDGSSQVELMAGLFRYVCGNGMVVSDRTVGSIRVPHRGDIISRVIEGSFQIIANSNNVIEKAREWSGLYLNSREQEAFATAAHNARFEPVVRTLEDGSEERVQHAIKPIDLLQPRRYDDRGDSLWHVMNRVQENVIRGGLVGRHVGEIGSRRPGRRITTREVKGIDQNITLNQKIWDNAELMAEVKQLVAAV